MQYKIPLQIENEDTIVAGLSLRQLGIMAIGFGIAYAIFSMLQEQVGAKVATVFAIFPALIWVIVALIRVSEMTFLPAVLNLARLHLNAKLREWSMGTDSFSDLEVGYVIPSWEKKETKASKSLESKMSDEASQKIGKL
jgi:hypothetical protein